MGDELPVLVAALPNEQARAIEESSREGRLVWVELKWPPGQDGPHMLEIYTPSSNDPIRLLAEPLGTESERGFALRVYPWEDASDTELAHALPDVSPDQLIGRSLAGGRFEILSVIGEGSIGAVYRARHTGLGIVVAVKVLHEAFQRDVEFSRRFYAEALALSRLDHPNLVHIYDFGQEPDGLLYISMAFVDGITLRALLATEKKIPEMKRSVSLMLQVCAGLGHAHARGLIHRDVKPDNVMIITREDDDGRQVENVKVLDFGFAVPPNLSGEVAQRLAGTPVYMSPEQCLGEELDGRSDVYACGIMLYELSTGTVPFLGRDAESIRQKQVSSPAPLISEKKPDADPRLVRIVNKALSKRREDRHPNMQELRAELKTLLTAEGAINLRASGAYERPSTPSLNSIPVPAPRRATAPPRAADWLETSNENYARLWTSQGDGAAEVVANALVSDASAWLGELAHERDPRRQRTKLVDLATAARILAGRAEVRALQMVSAVVFGLEDRIEAKDKETHEALSGVVKLFSDPEILAPICHRLLTNPEGREAAAELVAEARVAGAFALYSARSRIAADQQARIAFVTTMKSIGEHALPVIRAALERIHDVATSGAHQGAVELAEDLLLSTPATIDEVSGHLVVKYATSRVPSICRAAARALPRVWGERAKATLLDLLAHSEDGVCVAAIVGLREIDAIDLDAIALLRRLFERGPRSQQVTAAVLSALKVARNEAQSEAQALLEQLAP